MAKTNPLPKVLEVLKSGKDSADVAAQNIAVYVLVDDSCAPELISCAKEAFSATKPGASVCVQDISSHSFHVGHIDVCVILCGEKASSIETAMRTCILQAIPCACVCETALLVPEIRLSEEQEGLISIIASTERNDLLNKLASWLVSATDKGIAFAANFPFCRKAQVEKLVSVCALQNAAVGAVTLIPGADLPIMTTNQAKLALDIAASYGEELSAQRALELFGVLGAGFGYRALARQLVGLIPGVGAVIKASVGYAGTVATGNAVRARFDESMRASLLEKARKGLFQRGKDHEQTESQAIVMRDKDK